MRHVTCAILYCNRKILLGHRTEHVRTYKNTWDVLGGHVEEGETVDEALVREVQEGSLCYAHSLLSNGEIDRATSRDQQTRSILHVWRNGLGWW